MKVAYANVLKPSEEFPIPLNWPIMNTHELFRTSRSRTFLALRAISIVVSFFQFVSGNEMLTIVIDPSFTYSSLRNTYWCLLNWFLSWKCPTDWQSELTQLMHFGESTSIIAKPRYQKRFRKFWTWWACLVAFRYLKYFNSRERFLFPGRRSLESGTLNSNSLQFRNTGLFSIIGVSGDSCSSARHDKKTRLILILLIRDPRKKNTKYKDGLKIKNCYLYKLLKIFLFFQRI